MNSDPTIKYTEFISVFLDNEFDVKEIGRLRPEIIQMTYDYLQLIKPFSSDIVNDGKYKIKRQIRQLLQEPEDDDND